MRAETVWDMLRWVHYSSLAVWIGGIIFLSFVAAPSVHGSMIARPLAGEIVGRMLKRLNLIELGCFLILLVTGFSSYRFIPDAGRHLCYLLTALVLMGALTFFYGFYLTPKLEAIKEAAPGFYSLNEDAPAKREFRRLHRLYVRLMSLNLLMGAVVLYISIGTLD